VGFPRDRENPYDVSVFFTAGVYHFKLVDRGDYYDNIKTVGPDNKPTLTVTVS